MRRKARSLACVAALQHWQGNALGATFFSWRRAAQGAAARASTADAHFRHIARHQALAAWRQQARRQAVLARCGAALAQKSVGTLLRSQLRAWRAATQRRCDGRHKVQRCLARLANRQLSLTFCQVRVGGWRQPGRLPAGFLPTCADHLIRAPSTTISGASGLPPSRPSRSVRRPACAACCTGGWQQRGARGVAAWPAAARSGRACSAAWPCSGVGRLPGVVCVDTASSQVPALQCLPDFRLTRPSRHSHGTLHRAWATWQEAVAAQRLKASKLQAVLQHMRGARRAAALRGWREAAAHSRLLRAKAGAVVARLTHRTLASAFAGAASRAAASSAARAGGAMPPLACGWGWSLHVPCGALTLLLLPPGPNLPAQQAGARRTPSSRPSTTCCSGLRGACSRGPPCGAWRTGARWRAAGPGCAARASAASCGCRR